MKEPLGTAAFLFRAERIGREAEKLLQVICSAVEFVPCSAIKVRHRRPLPRAQPATNFEMEKKVLVLRTYLLAPTRVVNFDDSNAVHAS